MPTETERRNETRLRYRLAVRRIAHEAGVYGPEDANRWFIKRASQEDVADLLLRHAPFSRRTVQRWLRDGPCGGAWRALRAVRDLECPDEPIPVRRFGRWEWDR